MDRAVQLRVAGQSYKVVSSAQPEELQRLADQVSAKLVEVGGDARPAGAPSMLLAALALAHELEVERARRGVLEVKTRDMLRRVLLHIDGALDASEVSDASGGGLSDASGVTPRADGDTDDA